MKLAIYEEAAPGAGVPPGQAMQLVTHSASGAVIERNSQTLNSEMDLGINTESPDYEVEMGSSVSYPIELYFTTPQEAVGKILGAVHRNIWIERRVTGRQYTIDGGVLKSDGGLLGYLPGEKIGVYDDGDDSRLYEFRVAAASTATDIPLEGNPADVLVAFPAKLLSFHLVHGQVRRTFALQEEFPGGSRYLQATGFQPNTMAVNYEGGGIVKATVEGPARTWAETGDNLTNVAYVDSGFQRPQIAEKGISEFFLQGDNAGNWQAYVAYKISCNFKTNTQRGQKDGAGDYQIEQGRNGLDGSFEGQHHPLMTTHNRTLGNIASAVRAYMVDTLPTGATLDTYFPNLQITGYKPQPSKDSDVVKVSFNFKGQPDNLNRLSVISFVPATYTP